MGLLGDVAGVAVEDEAGEVKGDEAGDSGLHPLKTTRLDTKSIASTLIFMVRLSFNRIRSDRLS
jgi:hypothetical protein